MAVSFLYLAARVLPGALVRSRGVRKHDFAANRGFFDGAIEFVHPPATDCAADTQKGPISRDFRKPARGLEPRTPSLPLAARDRLGASPER
jgi:hypothetical protein